MNPRARARECRRCSSRLRPTAGAGGRGNSVRTRHADRVGPRRTERTDRDLPGDRGELNGEAARQGDGVMRCDGRHPVLRGVHRRAERPRGSITGTCRALGSDVVQRQLRKRAPQRPAAPRRSALHAEGKNRRSAKPGLRPRRGTTRRSLGRCERSGLWRAICTRIVSPHKTFAIVQQSNRILQSSSPPRCGKSGWTVVRCRIRQRGSEVERLIGGRWEAPRVVDSVAFDARAVWTSSATALGRCS